MIDETTTHGRPAKKIEQETAEALIREQDRRERAERDRDAALETLAAYVNAILRLPAPPAEVGDGPAERAGWALALLGDLCDAITAYRKARAAWQAHTPRASYRLEDATFEMFEVAGEVMQALANHRARLMHPVPVVPLRNGESVTLGDHVVRNEGGELTTDLPPFEWRRDDHESAGS